MPNIILTPVTLWRDFDDTLPLEEEILSEAAEGDVVTREVRFSGRQTNEGRVKIYARYTFPAGEQAFPAVMILFEAGQPFDEAFVRRFVDKGYGVLCVDYCGDNGWQEMCTVYPADIDYANYVRAGRHLLYAEPTARETSWYEWAGVARYAARYLAERPEVTSVGAVGLRTGGEILFKIAPYAPISCMISVCAAGWLAYRGMDKFGKDGVSGFDDERHRFIAGIDSQSYAPYVKCPVLLLSAINDSKYDYERVYDTFRQINPEVEKAILFSSRGNGLIGSHSLENLDLFLDKYLKGRLVFVCKPAKIEVENSEEGVSLRCEFDSNGEIIECGAFYTERVSGPKVRDWTRIVYADKVQGNVARIPLTLYGGSDRALAYAFVRYSNSFSGTSKIIEVPLDIVKRGRVPKSRVLYSSENGTNGIVAYRPNEKALADCFALGGHSAVKLAPGYGGIMGVTSPYGLVCYRVGEPRYLPPAGVSLRFDVWCGQNAQLKVTFYKDLELSVGYSATVKVEGGGKWKSVLFDADDFKGETGAGLEDFSGCVAVVFTGEEEFLLNNILWI